MAQHHVIVPLALPYGEVPDGFEYPAHPISEISATEAFNTGINNRDGEACIVCGSDLNVEHTHIIPQVETKVVSASFVRISL